MERYVRSELGLTQPDDEEPAVIEDFPLYHPLPYVIQTWSAWKTHGVLPESGGMNDQTVSWGHDRTQMDLLYSVVLDRLLPEMEHRRHQPSEEDPDESRATWEDMLNG